MQLRKDVSVPDGHLEREINLLARMITRDTLRKTKTLFCRIVKNNITISLFCFILLTLIYLPIYFCAPNFHYCCHHLFELSLYLVATGQLRMCHTPFHFSFSAVFPIRLFFFFFCGAAAKAKCGVLWLQTNIVYLILTIFKCYSCFGEAVAAWWYMSQLLHTPSQLNFSALASMPPFVLLKKLRGIIAYSDVCNKSKRVKKE